MVRSGVVMKCLIGATLVALFVAAASVGPAGASVPTGTPVFTTPLDITNAYAPFAAEAIKVFKGVKDGKAGIVIDHYLTETRTFNFGGEDVETHVIEEIEFVAGVLEEISRNHLAQADDGTLYYFGEIVNTYTDGAVTGHEGTWLVGGATLPSDPVDTANAPAPTIFMPAHPQKNDVFKQEDLFPTVDETDTVKHVGLKVRVAAGMYTRVIEVRETSAIAGTPPETKWYAPHVGAIKLSTKGEHADLIASTLTQ